MQFSIMTWNCLAQRWLNGKKDTEFAHTELMEYAEKGARMDKVVDILKQYQYDIICLQEIEVDSFIRDFGVLLTESPYIYVQQSFKKNGIPIGNVVLYNKNKFELKWQNSRAGGLLVGLLHIETNKQLYIANVHLKAGYDHEYTRLCQIKKVIRNLERVTNYTDYIIICGDYNTTDKMPLQNNELTVLQLLQTPENSIFTHSLDLYEIRPNIDIKETYFSPNGGPDDQFDHILCSKTLKYISHLDINKQEITRHKLPSENWPSDHILVGCTLEFDAFNN